MFISSENGAASGAYTVPIVMHWLTNAITRTTPLKTGSLDSCELSVRSHKETLATVHFHLFRFGASGFVYQVEVADNADSPKPLTEKSCKFQD